MLKSLDIFIGICTVMLVFAMVVTVLTQIFFQMLHVRSANLRDGIVNLFQQLGWELKSGDVKAIAEEMIQPASGGRLAGPKRDAITREEFIEELLAMAKRADKEHPEFAGLAAQVKELAPNGDPATMLANVRRAAMEIANENPALSAAAVKSIALAKGPTAEMAAQVFGIFDSSMARVSARFTQCSRYAVFGFSLMVAISLPLDTFDLFQRFARSEDARKQAVSTAEALVENQHIAAAAGQSAATSAREEIQSSKAEVAKLQAAEIMVVPKSWKEWETRASEVNWIGVLVSVLLLSLGAPFWFDVLKDTLKLRSALAGQEEQDRTDRQEATPGASQKIYVPSGERGDLAALG